MADGVLDAVIAGNDYNEGLGNLSRDSLIMINSLEPVRETGGLTFQLHRSLFLFASNVIQTSRRAVKDKRVRRHTSSGASERAQSTLKCSREIRKHACVISTTDNLLTEAPIFRDNLSALINDSYLLQFF